MMTLWCIFRSPLMFGGNLPDNDPFTLALLTNKRVKNVLMKSKNNHSLFRDTEKAAWIADDTGTRAKYLAVFNIGDKEGAANIPIDLKQVGCTTPCTITDLWSGKQLGKFSGEFAPGIAKHGPHLLLMDEATVGLDPQSRSGLLKLMKLFLAKK